MALKNFFQYRIFSNFSALSFQKYFSTSLVSQEEDTLYKSLVLDVRAHDKSVLDSYKEFTLMAANNLNVEFVKSWEPWRHIKRKPFLKSRFVHKDHRAVYEMRTYYLMMQFKNLTGSTLDTFLEYIERNLPEGVSMIVEKHQVVRMLDHLIPPEHQKNVDIIDDKTS